METLLSHDQNFKNLILDYPLQSLQFFAEPEASDITADVRVTPIRQEQLKERLGDRFRELDVPLLVEWPDGRRAAILFIIEEESDPARFSIHRLAHYCLDLSDLFDTHRVVPVVIFLRPGIYPSELRLGGDRADYLTFHFISCDLGRIRADLHLNSRNIVARLNLPNMAHEKHRRVEIYARACDGLVDLEKDVEKQKKYADYIDMYADLTEEEQVRYQMDYLSLNPRKDELMGLHQMIREEGLQEGRREGIQKGIQTGIQQGFHDGLLEAIELGISLRFGEKGLRLMGGIRQIDDIDRLKAIKNAILTVPNVSEFQKIVEN